MEPQVVNKGYQRYNSEEMEVNAELFSVICKRNVSTQEKLQWVQNLFGNNPRLDINAQGDNDIWNTPLHLAIIRNELGVVNFLFTPGADSTIENGDGKTPLNFAEERNHAEIIDALINYISQVAWPPSDTDRLASHNSQPVAANLNKVSVINKNSHEIEVGKQAASTVLPPFAKELKVNKRLKLSHEDFKQKFRDFMKTKFIRH